MCSVESYDIEAEDTSATGVCEEIGILSVDKFTIPDEDSTLYRGEMKRNKRVY